MDPFIWKNGLIKCLLHRADVICSSKKALDDEHENLRKIFFENHYPVKLLDKIIEEHIKRKKNATNKAVSEKSEYATVLKLPYVGKTSVAFARQLKLLLDKSGQHVRVVFRTTKVQDNFILKDPVTKEMSSRVVYMFTCRNDPDTKYIGFTNRTLKERFREHIKGGSAITDHISICPPCNNLGVTLADFTILKRCRGNEETSAHEALAIKDKKPSLNRNLIKPGKTFTLKIFN